MSPNPKPLSTAAASDGEQGSPVASAWSVLPVLGLAYLAAGLLASQLSVPPLRLSTPVFPAAGLALAAVLVYGGRVLWAVGAGSLALQILLIDQRGLDALQGVGIGAVIACGASAQAALGAWAVRRIHQGAPILLDEPRTILKMLLLGMLLPCLVSATCATLALQAGNPMPVRGALLLWASWWGADTLGVAIGLPVALALFGRPRRAWAPRRITVALPLVLALMLLVLGIKQIGRWYDARLLSLFERDAVALSRAAEQRLNAQLDALEAMYGVYLASDAVRADEFRRVAGRWLDRLSNLRSIGWHQRVERSALAAFEAELRASGFPDFKVTEREPSLTAQDNELVMLRYVVPGGNHAVRMGTNLLSIRDARAPMLAAMRADEPQATELFRPNDVTLSQTVIVVHRSVRGPDGGVRGVLFVSLLMEDTLETMRGGAPRYLQACLVDVQAVGAKRALAGPPACQGDDFVGPLTHRLALPFAGRSWELRVRAESPGQVAAANAQVGDNMAAWLFSQSALLATAMLGMLLLIITGRTRRTEQAVAERTAELEHEIAQRERMERGRAVAEAANLAKNQFLSRMSHELRTPLNAVLGFAQLLESDRAAAGDERQRQWAAHIQEAGWHLLALINDVLDLSRIEAGTVALVNEPVALEPLIAQSMALVEAEARARGIALVNERGPAATVQGDTTRLKQVLVNLLSNAVKYNREGGEVRVSTRVGQRADGVAVAWIGVCDTGPGLSPQQLDQLFQPFNRLGRERTSTEGIGIGLAIAKQLIERQGGVIQVESTPGEGATFTVCLPLAEPGAVRPS